MFIATLCSSVRLAGVCQLVDRDINIAWVSKVISARIYIH